jgi:hypothetical protein
VSQPYDSLDVIRWYPYAEKKRAVHNGLNEENSSLGRNLTMKRVQASDGVASLGNNSRLEEG